MCNGYRRQPTSPAFTNVALTSVYTGNRYSTPVAGFEKISIDINYARGAAEVSSKMFMQLDHSPDEGVTWYNLVIDTTGATSVITPREWEIGTTNKLNVLVDIAYKMMRISLRESGVVTNAGIASVTYTLSGI